jgi:hypothetical protein
VKNLPCPCGAQAVVAEKFEIGESRTGRPDDK